MWTFQPDADIEKLVEEHLAKHPGKDRTEFLNDTLKLKFPQMFLDDAERKLSAAQSLVEDLRRTSASKH